MNHVGKETHDSGLPDSHVRVHLDRILSSKALARSESLSNFLRFVVEETLAGRGERLKAQVIAVEALGRNKNFDPKADPIVSIQAGRLRRALGRYYEGEGRQETIRIELPKGGYLPSIGRKNPGKSEIDNDLWQTNGRNQTAVAVIPLVDLDKRDNNVYFGIGLTQELVAAIARFQELNVLDVPPLNSGESVAEVVRKLGRDSTARFVLSGTFHKSNEALILRMQLTDARDATVVWTEKLTRNMSASDMVELEESIARHVASTVAENFGVIPRVLTKEVHPKQTDELSIYDAILRFRHYQAVVTNEARDLAIDALERAIEMDPNYALSRAMLSESISDAYGLRIDSNIEVVNRGKDLARQAIALDPNCQHAHWARAYACFHKRDRDGYLASAEKCIELNPNNGYLVGISAWAMALVGEWDRGLSMLGRLMEQNPYYPQWMHLAPYLNHFRQGEFGTALEHAKRFNVPSLAWDPILRAAALAELGRVDEARAVYKELLSGFPAAAADPAHYLRGYIFIDELVDQVAAGLQKAGATTDAPTQPQN